MIDEYVELAKAFFDDAEVSSILRAVEKSEKSQKPPTNAKLNAKNPKICIIR